MATTTAPIAPATAHVGWNRALGVAGATFAAVAVWALAMTILSASLVVQFGNGAPQTIGIELVVIGSLTDSLLGFGSLVLLEEFTARAPTIWPPISIGVSLVPLILHLLAATTQSTKEALP